MSEHTHKFISKAIKRPGALTKKAKATGMSVAAFARRALRKGSKASTLTKQQAGFYSRVLKKVKRS